MGAKSSDSHQHLAEWTAARWRRRPPEPPHRPSSTAYPAGVRGHPVGTAALALRGHLGQRPTARIPNQFQGISRRRGVWEERHFPVTRVGTSTTQLGRASSAGRRREADAGEGCAGARNRRAATVAGHLTSVPGRPGPEQRNSAPVCGHYQAVARRFTLHLQRCPPVWVATASTTAVSLSRGAFSRTCRSVGRGLCERCGLGLSVPGPPSGTTSATSDPRRTSSSARHTRRRHIDGRSLVRSGRSWSKAS